MPLIAGTEGADTLSGGVENDTFEGGAGDDHLIDASGGNDRFLGGAGSDRILASRGAGVSSVFIDGGDGDDQMTVNGVSAAAGGQITATILGGDGADYVDLFGGAVSATVDLGAGADSLSISMSNAGVTATLGPGADRVSLNVQVAGAFTAPTLTDFQPGDGGDRINIPGLQFWLTNYDQSNPFSSGHMRLVQSGTAAVLQVDVDGGNNGYVDLLRFAGVQTSQFRAANLFDFSPAVVPGSGGGQPAGQVITGLNGITNGPADGLLQGGAGADTITGLGLPDTIYGGAGNDLIDGGASDDTIFGEAGNDTVSGGAGADEITGGQRDLVRGQDGNDTLIGDSGFDAVSLVTLDGGGGDDTIRFWLQPGQAGIGLGGDGRDFIRINGYGDITADGGAGDDRFLVSNGSGATIALTLGAGSDALSIEGDAAGIVRVSVADFAAGAGGDRLQLFDYLQKMNPAWNAGVNPFGAGLIRLAGSGPSTIVQVRSGDQWIDTFTLQNVAPASLTAANLEGYAPDGYRLEGLTLSGGIGADPIMGGVGADVIDAGGGDDVITAGRGDDTVFGGAGNDLIAMQSGNDLARGGAGDDTISDLAGEYDAFYGDDGNDVLGATRFDIGGAGRFTLDGGEGADTLSANSSFPTNLVSAVLLGGAGSDTITVGGLAHATIDAGAGNDYVTIGRGWIGDIAITLGSGADVLVFHDPMATKGVAIVRDFRPDEDTLLVKSLFPDDGYLSAAFDGDKGTLRFVQQGADTLLQINLFTTTGEWMTAVRLVGVDAHAIRGVSTVKVDVGTIVVNPGPDLAPPPLATTPVSGMPLQLGGDGPDTLAGASGADTINGGDGLNYLRGNEGADSLIGGAQFDDINGNVGADTASGGAGDDWVVGGKDNDSLQGGLGGDLVYGNIGADTCDGGQGADIVRGGQDDDLVFGGAGDDFVSGDRGADTMIGDVGADIFHTFGEAGIDRVLDFSLAQGDRVQLDPGTRYTVAQSGADTVISMTGGGQMILVGVQMSTLTTGWIFGA